VLAAQVNATNVQLTIIKDALIISRHRYRLQRYAESRFQLLPEFSSSFGSKPVSSSNSGRSEQSTTLAAIICLISQRSGDEMRFIALRSLASSSSGMSTRGTVAGRSGLRALSSASMPDAPKVASLRRDPDGLRSSPVCWSTSCK